MFTLTTKRLGIIGAAVGGIIGVALTFGNLGITQEVAIWRKDVSNVVRMFPTSLEINVSGSTVTTGKLTSGTLTEGGGIRATSTDDTSATFLASDFDVENMIEFKPTVTGITATLPATSTLTSFIPNAGDHRDLMICSATTTAAISFTLAQGTGMNLQQATSTLAIATGQCAILNFYRATDTDIEVYYDLGY